MMQEQEFKALLERYTSDQCTEEERAWLEHAYLKWNDTDQAGLTLEQMQVAQNLMWPIVEQETKPDVEDKPIRRISLWPRIAIVAAVAAITLGIWLYYASGLFGGRHPDTGRDPASAQYTTDIVPGKNTATITLANGKTINLSDAKTGVVIGNDLTYNDGTAVANLSPTGRDGVAREGSNNSPLSPQGGSLPGGEGSKAQMLTTSTPRGGTYQVTLSDGTHVWLNADSKISFPSQFSGKQRKILLSGEAYFEVAKNKRMPFVVESNGQQVEVLGTHFNINAYQDEGNTKTTLLEGSVRVAFLSPLGRDGRSPERVVVLKPNQQSILLRRAREGLGLTGSNRIKVQNVDIGEAIAWKNGKFVFEYENIESVMRKLARWYDAEIIYQGNFGDKTFTGSISRKDNISKILEKITYTQNVHFKIEGRRITVMP